jgi:cysteinyl-tRNA synthetase
VGAGHTEQAGADAPSVASFMAHMDDDLDTPGALAEIFDLARRAHQVADAGDHDEGRRLAATAAVLCGAMGLALADFEPGLDAATASQVAERDRARAAGQYDRSDDIRRALESQGWVVEDGPEGTRLHRRTAS